MRRMAVDGVSVGEARDDIEGESCDIKLSMVCNGSSGSHDSIQSALGSKTPEFGKPGFEYPLILVVLF